MLDAIGLKGLWHLPEKPEKRVAGILKFTPKEDMQLDLIGTFNEEDNGPSFLFNNERNFPVIYGETSDGKYITLFNCFKYGSYNFSSSFPLVNFKIGFLLQGYYLENFEDEFFDYIEIGIKDLSKWIGRNTHNLKIEDRAKLPTASFELHQKNTQRFKFSIDDDLEMELVTYSAFYGVSNNDYDIKQEAYCTIYSKRKLTLWSFVQKANLFNSLFSLGTLQRTKYSYLKLFNRGLQEQITESKTQ